MYDASAGRWINRDPIGYAGGVNLYGYCGGGPVGRTDPSGMAAVVGGGAVILLAVVAAGFLLMSSPQGQRSMELGADATRRMFETIAGALRPRVPAAESDCGEEIIDVPGDWPASTGIPGTVQRGNRQSRRYGPQGFPLVDRDSDCSPDVGFRRTMLMIGQAMACTDEVKITDCQYLATPRSQGCTPITIRHLWAASTSLAEAQSIDKP